MKIIFIKNNGDSKEIEDTFTLSYEICNTLELKNYMKPIFKVCNEHGDLRRHIKSYEMMFELKLEMNHNLIVKYSLKS